MQNWINFWKTGIVRENWNFSKLVQDIRIHMDTDCGTQERQNLAPKNDKIHQGFQQDFNLSADVYLFCSKFVHDIWR